MLGMFLDTCGKWIRMIVHACRPQGALLLANCFGLQHTLRRSPPSPCLLGQLQSIVSSPS